MSKLDLVKQTCARGYHGSHKYRGKTVRTMTADELAQLPVTPDPLALPRKHLKFELYCQLADQKRDFNLTDSVTTLYSKLAFSGNVLTPRTVTIGVTAAVKSVVETVLFELFTSRFTTLFTFLLFPKT